MPKAKMKGIEGTKELFEVDDIFSYIKKPVPVLAIKMKEEFWVESFDGKQQGKAGDYLVQEVEGDLAMCDAYTFEKTYEKLGVSRLIKPGAIKRGA